MKFSYQWLRDMTPGLTATAEELQRLITMKTAECEGVEPVGAHFQSVVAARILSVDPLPKGKNRRVTIDAGDGKEHTVVCGASNARPGLIAAWVPPGTYLGDKQIGSAQFEGVQSEGMLASAEELGINRDHSGLIEFENAAPGASLPGLKADWVIEIDNKSLTHRPDLWGHFGMAREVAAIAAGATLRDPVDMTELPTGPSPIKVEVADPVLCPRYSAQLFENVRVIPSPFWLQARLEAVGLNARNNIVDVTNYILAELPQPLHAFDADKLAGPCIYVRNAREGESLKALNGETYALDPADLVIADSAGPVALAGVIGGMESAISETTTRIVVESANFHPTSVRLTSARHKLRTDASMRYEKSLDPENTLRGLARVTALLREVCPGIHPVGGPADVAATRQKAEPVEIPVDFIVRKLGKELSQSRITEIFIALGFGVLQSAPGVLLVTVPSWRATKDVSLKDDLVEEIGRIVGYDEITPAPPLVATVVPPANPMRESLRTLRAQFAAQGFTEVYNYSFVNESDVKRFGFEIADHLPVKNPIASELTHLRRSLLPGVFHTLVANTRHFRQFRLFEIGREIHPVSNGGLPDEKTHAVAALYNAYGDEQEFFELKRVLECAFCGARLHAAVAKPYEHPERSADITWRGTPIGRLFELHPSLLKDAGLEGRAVLFDVDLDAALALSKRDFKYVSPRKYPTSGFDLSVLTGLRVPVAEIQTGLARFAGSDLAAIEFLRQYAGAPLPEGQKSVSYHLEVGSLMHTMTAEEVTQIRNRIIDGMRGLGYDLRV